MEDQPGEQAKFRDPDQYIGTHEMRGTVEIFFPIGKEDISVNIAMHYQDIPVRAMMIFLPIEELNNSFHSIIKSCLFEEFSQK
jgi:hypothetical protein